MISYDLDIATQGLLSNNSLQIVGQGLFKIEIDIIEPPINIPVINYPGLPSVLDKDLTKKDKKKLKKRIKVTLNYEGQEYVEYAYSQNLDITINDIDVKIIKESKPKIIIEFKHPNF